MRNRYLLCIGILLSVVVLTKAVYSQSITIQSAGQLWAEKSFRLAVGQYKSLLDSGDLTPNERREVQFKYADSSWRTKEQVRYEDAIKLLKELIESDEKDRWRAEASESLADHYLEINRWQYQNEIKQYYENAREYWAGSKDIDVARRRFIDATFKLGDYITSNWGWYYYGDDIKPMRVEVETVPPNQPQNRGLEILYRDILKIVKSDEDKAKVTYSLAMSYANNYNRPDDRKKSIEYFQKVINELASTEWADDAYYQLGVYYQQGNEFSEALKAFQALLSRYRRGESQFVDNAKNAVENITKPQLQVNSSYTYLPGSEVQLNFNWRNLDGAKVALYKIDLDAELRFDLSKGETGYDRGISNYQEIVQRLVETSRYTMLPQHLSWHVNLKNEGKYLWHNETKGLAEWRSEDDEEKADPGTGTLEPGAYLFLATAAGVKAYDLILVTDIGVVTKTAESSALFYVHDAKSGEPRAQAKVKYQYRYYDNRGDWRWSQGEGTTDGNGLLRVALNTFLENATNSQKQLFAVATHERMQAFAQGNYYSYHYGSSSRWRIYAYSDRPAYRPNEEVAFKATLRIDADGGYRTPSMQRVKARINDARGNKVFEKVYTLNDFGTFHDAFTLDEKATLGEYTLQVYDEAERDRLGSATLFRLEEYKLPEFLVNMKPKPKEDGSSAYRLGDVIDVELDAQYYFGGPVAEAEVEYLIYQQPYAHHYYPPHEYPWYFDESFYGRANYYNQGTLLKKEKITTDAEGKAAFSFETPEDSQRDLKFRIEARVVDQSRREISSSQEIKVTKNAFYAYLTPKQHLYRPGDKTEVDIKVLTANNEPVAVDGKITVFRNWWHDPIIREEKIVTPAGYDETELFTKFVKTDEEGEAVFTFEPERDGYYLVKFTAFDDAANEITSQANIFVCDKESKDLGYRYGGIQIIAEKDTYRIGETAHVMVVSDKPGSWVLFSVETDEILGFSLHGLEGTVKLIEFPVKETFTPNIFLSALSVDDYQLKIHNLPVIVPPDGQFLNVKLISDREEYRPQEEGVFDIEVTDINEQPVVGEVSLGIVDASVYYIQEEWAQDIREFFYGEKRQLSVQTNSSFYQRRYAKLVRNEEERLIPEEVLKHQMLVGDKITKEEVNKQDITMLRATGFGAVGGVEMEMMADMLDESGIASPMSAAPMVAMEGKGFDAMAVSRRKDVRFSMVAGEMDNAEMQAPGQLKTPTLRSDFRSTMLWQPMIVTDENGRATVKVQFPDSLTTWRATARSVTRGTEVGNTTHETRTKKDVIVRLQAPRFFTERDEVTLSANVHNYADAAQKIKVTIEAQGLEVEDEASVWVEVPSQGEERVDWKARALRQGTAKVTVAAQGTEDADAMVKMYPVIPHGIEKFIARSLEITGEAGVALDEAFTLDLPKERVEASTSLKLTLSPSLAGAMLDALPYLADYPYGCVEQTMSRFLPGVIVKDTMKKLGLSAREVDDYINGVLVPREDPQHPGRKSATTLSQIDRMTKAGLDRLYDFQRSDGGWGWWKEGNSDRFMTAYVVWGLGLARDAGVSVKGDVMSRAVRFLQQELVEEEDDPDMLAWMIHALSAAKSRSQFEDKQIERLWTMREELNPYTRALFALSLHYRGDAARSMVLARNLADGMVEEKSNNTVHWGESGVHYRWSEGGVEATAFVIKALSNIMPESEYLKPAVKWMALNRRGARWKNTRDTAIALLGLSDYLKTTTELVPDFDYTVLVNGKEVRAGHVDRENIFTFDRMVELPNEALKNGENKVEVRLSGAGALYVSGYLKYFTLEENITPAGNEVFVTRQYFTEDTEETLLKGYTTDWRPLESGEAVKSGQRIKVEIMLDAKNHYEYLVVEDYKPAGLEAVELKSGSGWADDLDYKGKESGNRTWLYKEFRDQKAAFFIDKLKQGQHRITYELRAEVPGTFHGMPNMTHAMYVPEIRSNSSEMIVTVGE